MKFSNGFLSDLGNNVFFNLDRDLLEWAFSECSALDLAQFTNSGPEPNPNPSLVESNSEKMYSKAIRYPTFWSHQSKETCPYTVATVKS
jgi:hypothetical protein